MSDCRRTFPPGSWAHHLCNYPSPSQVVARHPSHLLDLHLPHDIMRGSCGSVLSAHVRLQLLLFFYSGCDPSAFCSGDKRRMTAPLESSLENEFGDSWAKLAQSCPHGTQWRVGLPRCGQSQWCGNTHVDLVHKLSYPCNCLCIAVLLPWDDKAPWLGSLKIFVWTDQPMLLLSCQGGGRGGGVL